MTSAQNLLNTFQQAEAMMASGDLRQAAALCRDMLDQHPDFPYGYYLMSSLFRATGTYNNALTFSQMAVKMQPDNPAFLIQHGQILFSLGDNPAAAEAFRGAHRAEPNDPLPLLLWADAMAQQNEFDEAMRLFAKARAVRDIPEIDLHEGLCHMMKGALDKAEKLFARVIERAPEYDWGYIQKAKLHMQRRESAAAESCFARALKCNPNAYEALHGMAMVSEQQGRYDVATNYAMQAIQSNPGGWESHMQLGSLLLTQHQYAMAEQVLVQAHGLQPGNVYITQLYLQSLLRQQKQPQAIALLEEALRLAPDDHVLRYFHAMFKDGMVASAPKDYISNLFDQYADRFDHHLVQVLNYRVPETMAQIVAELTTSRKMSMLDLGCGTGLAAQAFHDITTQRIGVDLSPRMLARARDRKLYNALFAQDIIEFMGHCEQRFDLVVAADVLVYIGDVSPMLKATRSVLAQDGFLVFSVEKESSQPGYHLKPTGRYTHAQHYIDTVSAEEGYEIVQRQEMMIRTENDMPVPGLVYILKKRQTH